MSATEKEQNHREQGYYVKGGVFTGNDYKVLKEGHQMWSLGPFLRKDSADLVRRALVLDWSHEEHASFFISHSEPSSYWVVGGRYKDTAFQELEGDQEERYGPYGDYEEARKMWRAKSLAQIDDCMVRYRLDKIGT